MRCLTPLLIYFIAQPAKLHMAIISSALLAACPVECTNPFTGEVVRVIVPAADVVNCFYDADEPSAVEDTPKEDPSADAAETDPYQPAS